MLCYYGSGEEIDLEGTYVTVEVPVKAVSMSDEQREYRADGNIISFIYKGNHYNYTVRTATEEDFVLDEDDLWNEGGPRKSDDSKRADRTEEKVGTGYERFSIQQETAVHPLCTVPDLFCRTAAGSDCLLCVYGREREIYS